MSTVNAALHARCCFCTPCWCLRARSAARVQNCADHRVTARLRHGSSRPTAVCTAFWAVGQPQLGPVHNKTRTRLVPASTFCAGRAPPGGQSRPRDHWDRPGMPDRGHGTAARHGPPRSPPRRRGPRDRPDRAPRPEHPTDARTPRDAVVAESGSRMATRTAGISQSFSWR